MSDQGHQLTDRKLKELERRMAEEYRRANEEVSAKLQEYLRQMEAGRQAQERLLKAGQITQRHYERLINQLENSIPQADQERFCAAMKQYESEHSK